MAHTIQRSPRGADAQFGFAVETAYGTQVTPATNFLAATSGGIDLVPRDGRIRSNARRPGQLTDSVLTDIVYDNGGEGSLSFELQRSNMLKLWRWAIGHNATPAQQGASTAYKTTFLKDVASSPMNGVGSSLSIQIGVPMRTGAVEPFDFIGCKCTGWNMECDAGGIATVTFDVDAHSAIHTTDLVAPTYPAEYVPLGWHSAAVVKRAGVMLPGVRNVKFATENGLTGDDRKLFDASGHYAEPKFDKPLSASLDLEVEPEDLALTYDDWRSNTPREWTVEFIGGNIALTYFYSWILTIPAGVIQGDPPKPNGDEMVTHPLNIRAGYDGVNAVYKLDVIETAAAI